MFINTDIQRSIDWQQLSDYLRISHGKAQLSSKHYTLSLGLFGRCCGHASLSTRGLYGKVH